MKKRSRSLTRSRKSYARFANSGAMLVCPLFEYTVASSAMASAKFGSSSMARLRCGMASRRGFTLPLSSASE